MALPIEALTNEQRLQERGEKRGAIERLTVKNNIQAFLKDLLMMTVDIRENAEDILLADRAALTSEQPEIMREVKNKVKIPLRISRQEAKPRIKKVLV
jgi:hypothetical protein